jgi:hypothetical protein
MSDTSKKDQVVKWLAYYGVHDYIEIEDEAVPFLLGQLMQPDVSRVRIDSEGGLVIEFDDDQYGETDYE